MLSFIVSFFLKTGPHTRPCAIGSIKFEGRLIQISAIKSVEHLVSLASDPDDLEDIKEAMPAAAQKFIDSLVARGHPDYCPDPNWRP